jgi:hypothetical protein
LLGDSTGTIAPGKKADILGVDGDPGINIGLLRDVSNLKLIMQNGRIVKDDLNGASHMTMQGALPSNSENARDLGRLQKHDAVMLMS